MAITQEILDEVLKSYKGPDDITSPDGLLKQLTKAANERAMQAEMTEQLGYEKSDQEAKLAGKLRNRKSKKTCDSTKAPLISRCPVTIPGRSSQPLSPNTSASSRVRRQDPVHIFPRQDNPRDRRPSQGNLRHRRIAGAH
jgi:hypothetical protein